MKKLTIILLLFADVAFTQNAIHIIPEPVSLQTLAGEFVLMKDVKVNIPNSNADIRKVAQFFVETIALPTGFRLNIIENIKFNSSKSINFILDENVLVSPDRYVLEVSSKSINIRASGSQGMFYAVQTLMQLLPKQIESNSTQKIIWKIPAVSISDAPRYGWRGIMLDVSRHFFPKEYVKKFIDQLARLKFNSFH